MLRQSYRAIKSRLFCGENLGIQGQLPVRYFGKFEMSRRGLAL